MFDSILLRNPRINGRFDLGLLAESLLFFDKVYLTFNSTSFLNMFDQLDIDTWRMILEQHHLHVSFSQNLFACLSEVGGDEERSFLSFRIEPEQRRLSAHEEMCSQLESKLGSDRASRKRINKLLAKIHECAISEVDQGSIVEACTRDMVDEERLRKNFLSVSDIYNMGLGIKKFNIKANEIEKGKFKLHSDVDLASPKTPVGLPDLSLDLFLTAIADYHLDEYLASRYMSGICTDPLSSKLITSNLQALCRRIIADRSQIDLFQQQSLGKSKSIKETINSGQRSFEDFLPVLEKSKRFRSWLKEGSCDEQLITRYFDACTAGSWIDSIPGKALRLLIPVGIDVAAWKVGIGIIDGTAASLAYGTTDAFLAERLIKGWRPSQFVEARLRPFVRP